MVIPSPASDWRAVVDRVRERARRGSSVAPLRSFRRREAMTDTMEDRQRFHRRQGYGGQAP